ncbi:hypothetical protein [Streptomyces mobaraensis]|uniref:hypothetical protein n=1 Tax=Streptomyces mobaraensis TaxID=35621 RepID=UPI0012ACA7C9|nr:hypothetical protein [Streptomyces mobaraensis]
MTAHLPFLLVPPRHHDAPAPRPDSATPPAPPAARRRAGVRSGRRKEIRPAT